MAYVSFQHPKSVTCTGKTPYVMVLKGLLHQTRGEVGFATVETSVLGNSLKLQMQAI